MPAVASGSWEPRASVDRLRTWSPCTAPQRTDPALPTSGPVPLPVLRTLGTPVIRWTVAILLFVGGWLAVSQMLIGHATSADGNFGLDFADYHVAAQRLTATGTPYAPEMLDGPIGAIGRDRYRYPPPLAQLLAPLNSLSHRDAASVWLGLQGLAIAGAVFIALRTGGARRGPEAVLWVGVAVAWFLPAYDTLWEGNVSGFLALAVALAATGGRTGAVAAVLATFLKVAPVLLLLPAVTGTRRALITAIVTTAAILGVSAVLVPGAWADYLVVLPHTPRRQRPGPEQPGSGRDGREPVGTGRCPRPCCGWRRWRWPPPAR